MTGKVDWGLVKPQLYRRGHWIAPSYVGYLPGRNQLHPWTHIISREHLLILLHLIIPNKLCAAVSITCHLLKQVTNSQRGQQDSLYSGLSWFWGKEFLSWLVRLAPGSLSVPVPQKLRFFKWPKKTMGGVTCGVCALGKSQGYFGIELDFLPNHNGLVHW